jgi:hypothetical protein
MATKETFDRCFALMQSAYDKRIDAERRYAYMALLESVPDDLLINGVKHACTRYKFFPTVAELMDAIKELQLWSYNIPTSAAAWQEIVDAPAPRKAKQECETARALRLACIEYSNTDPEQYWATMKQLIRHDRTCEACQVEVTIMPKFSHPIIEHVARRLGWPNRFWSDNLGVDRGRFISTYENEIKVMTGQAATIPTVRAFIQEQQADHVEIQRMFASEAMNTGERLLADVAMKKSIR